MLGVPHPTNDPSLVSYHRPELLRQLPALEMANHCWCQLDTNFADSTGNFKSVKEKYLPLVPAEPRSAYESRLTRSPLRSRDSIRHTQLLIVSAGRCPTSLVASIKMSTFRAKYPR